MQRLIYIVWFVFFVPIAAYAEPGDGPGAADIRFNNNWVAVTGECRDWAFRTVAGMPSLSVDVGEGQNADELMFYDNATYTDGDAAWSIQNLDTLKQTETGYILTGVFMNAQEDNKPTPMQIEVVCP